MTPNELREAHKLVKTPGLREIYTALSSGASNGCETEPYRQRFSDLVDRIRLFGEPWGFNAVGWYLYWLFPEALEKGIKNPLRAWNMIFSDYMTKRFVSEFPPFPTACYSAQVADPLSAYDRAVYPILRYVGYTKLGNQEQASNYRRENLPRILREFVGLPFVRIVLPQDIDSELWNLIVSLSAYSTHL